MKLAIKDSTLTDKELEELQRKWNTKEAVLASLKANGMELAPQPKGSVPANPKLAGMDSNKLLATLEVYEMWHAFYDQQISIMESELRDLSTAVEQIGNTAERPWWSLLARRRSRNPLSSRPNSTQARSTAVLNLYNQKKNELGIAEALASQLSNNCKAIHKAVSTANAEERRIRRAVYANRRQAKEVNEHIRHVSRNGGKRGGYPT